MATMDTAYLPGGGIQTTTSGAAGGGAGGGGMYDALLPLLKQAMERKNASATLRAQLEEKQIREQMAAPKKVPINQAYGNPTAGGGNRGGREAAPIDMLSMQRAAMEGEAMMQDRLPAPMKLYGGNPGTVAGMVMDTQALNARQRQQFLPKESSQQAAYTKKNADGSSSSGMFGDGSESAIGAPGSTGILPSYWVQKASGA